MAELKAVLWDMDGTLIDSEPFWFDEEMRLMADAGATWTESDALAMVGSAIPTTAAAMQARGLDLEVDEIIDALVSAVSERIARDIPWQPGVPELHASLRGSGARSALVTSSPLRVAEPLLAAAPGWFNVIVTGDSVVNRKPDPEPYERAMDGLGVEPSECVAIEDSLPGIASALAAGVVTVAVQHHISLDETGAHRVVTTLEEMTEEALRALHAEYRAFGG